MYNCVFLVVALWLIHPSDCAIREETDVYACHDEPVHLHCQKKESTLVIYHATFSTDAAFAANQRCNVIEPSLRNETCSDDVRLVVNSKCSGIGSCKFQVSELVPRECYGEGMLRITYGCVSPAHVAKFCNVVINGSTAEGFIQNPGYPNYYPDLLKCTWTIRANEGQHVLISVLDMSMQPTGGTASDCRDYLQIFDGTVKVMHSCGQDRYLLHTFESISNFVQIVFTSHDVWPSRGILLYYRVLGCATLPVPHHGYLVYRNVSMAHYMCCARHVFGDDYKRNRFLYCLDGNRWNGTVVSCRNIRALREWKNVSGITFEDDGFGEMDTVARISIQSVSIVFDIMIPSIIMVGMVVCNVIIVIVILRMRKRRQKEDSGDLDGVPFKTDMEPQPSTSKQNGLDTVEPVVTRV